MPSRKQLKLSAATAEAIFAGFTGYHSQFKAITRMACYRFENRDWPGMQVDSGERLDLYSRAVAGVVAEGQRILGRGLQDKSLWRQ
jgi:isocitrate dehydrogenase kinase/phosphatase